MDKFRSNIIAEEESVGCYKFVQKGFLNTYGKYLDDDWLDIYAINDPEEDWLKYTKDFDNSYLIKKPVDLCFFNVDGSYWEMFAKDESLLQTVENHVQRQKGFLITHISLKNKEI